MYDDSQNSWMTKDSQAVDYVILWANNKKYYADVDKTSSK